MFDVVTYTREGIDSRGPYECGGGERQVHMGKEMRRGHLTEQERCQAKRAFRVLGQVG